MNNTNGVQPLGFWYFVYAKRFTLFKKRLQAAKRNTLALVWRFFLSLWPFGNKLVSSCDNSIWSVPFFYGLTALGGPKVVQIGLGWWVYFIMETVKIAYQTGPARTVHWKQSYRNKVSLFHCCCWGPLWLIHHIKGEAQPYSFFSPQLLKFFFFFFYYSNHMCIHIYIITYMFCLYWNLTHFLCENVTLSWTQHTDPRVVCLSLHTVANMW